MVHSSASPTSVKLHHLEHKQGYNEFIMFPPSSDKHAPTPRRRPHSRKKPANHIPRPPNAFILFRSDFIRNRLVSTDVETNHSTLSTIIGLTWSNMPEEERQVWHRKAKEALAEHKRKYPKYAFKPVQAKDKDASSPRKVREVEPKDIKRCAKIAQLLIEGKKGDELNVAIQEFDKVHVPDIVTRFEAPITADSFRGCSPSVPLPETQDTTTSTARSISPRTVYYATPSTTTPPTVEVQEESVIAQPIPIKQDPALDLVSSCFDNVTRPVLSINCEPEFLFEVGNTDYLPPKYFGPVPTTINSSFDFDNWFEFDSPLFDALIAPPSTAMPMWDISSTELEELDRLLATQFPSGGLLPQGDTDTVYGSCANVNIYPAFSDTKLDGSEFILTNLDFTSYCTAIQQYS